MINISRSNISLKITSVSEISPKLSGLFQALEGLMCVVEFDQLGIPVADRSIWRTDTSQL